MCYMLFYKAYHWWVEGLVKVGKTSLKGLLSTLKRNKDKELSYFNFKKNPHFIRMPRKILFSIENDDFKKKLKN